MSLTQILDDTFHRSNTSPGSTGSTTGVGNGWTDKLGLIYSINSDQLIGNGSALSLAPNTGILYRAADSYRDQQCVFTYIANSDGNASWGSVLRVDVTNGNWYAFKITNNIVPGALSAYAISGGNTESPTATLLNLVFPSGSYNIAHVNTVTASVIGASPTTVTVTLTDVTSSTVISTFTLTDSTSGLQQAGSWGLLAQDDASAFSEVVLSDGDSSTPILGSCTFVSSSGTVINMLGTAPSGTSTPTYQWYASQTSNFTPSGSNILSGQTSFALAHTTGTAAGSAWYYLFQTLVDPSNTIFSPPVVGAIQGTVTEPLGLLGDSITDRMTSSGSVSHFIDTLLLYAPNRNYSTVNQGVDGSASGDWTSTGTLLAPAITAFLDAGVTHVLVMLGANDSHENQTVENYLANMASICASLVSAGFTVIVNGPTAIIPGALSNAYTAESLGLLHDYNAGLNSICNNVTILSGDRNVWAYSAQNSDTFLLPAWDFGGDMVHPSEAGFLTLAEYWARGYLAAVQLLGPVVTQGSGGSGHFTFGCNFIN